MNRQVRQILDKEHPGCSRCLARHRLDKAVADFDSLPVAVMAVRRNQECGYDKHNEHDPYGESHLLHVVSVLKSGTKVIKDNHMASEKPKNL
jgi:hypothetical protein